MVVKTEVCAFTEFRIYPGHGSRLVRRDGLVVHFLSSKAKRLYKQGIKPAKLTWTTAWRRLHKKGSKEDGGRARKRRVARAPRAFVGMSLDDLNKKKSELPQLRAASKEAAAAALAERAKKREAAKAASAKGDGAGKTKSQQQAAQGARADKGAAKQFVSKNR